MAKKLTSKKTTASRSTPSSKPSGEKSPMAKPGTPEYGAQAQKIQDERSASYERMVGPEKAARAAAVEELKKKMIAAGRYTEGEPEIPLMPSPYKFLNVTGGKPYMSRTSDRPKPNTFKKMMARILQGLLSGARSAETVIAGSHLNVAEPKPETLRPPMQRKK